MAENWMLKAVLSAKDNMSPALKNIAKTARTTRKYLADVGGSAVNLAGHIGLPLGLITGALAGFSVAGLKQAVSNFALLGDQVHKGAQAIGVSVDEYQRLTYVAGQSGVPVQELGASMGRLNKSIGEAAGGKNKDLAALFKRAGISMRDANGQLRSATDMLPELADLFARNGNAATQARMGNALFGRSWQTLAPLLQGGKDGIDELNARYKMLGIAVEEDGILAGEKFGDQMDDLNQVLRSYGNTITAKLLPVLAPMLEKTIQWAVANRDLITTRVSAFVKDIADNLAKVDWSGVINGIGEFVGGIKDFISWIGGAKNALIALAIVMNAQALMASIALIGSIWRLIWGLGTLAVKAVPSAIASMGGLGSAMTAASGKGKALLGTLGKIGGVAGAAFAGWEIGTLINDKLINPGMEKLTGEKGQTLGGWIYDKLNPEEGGRQSLVGPAAQVKASGQIEVSFKDAPPGMRVTQVSGGDVPLNTDVGYRSYAMGMP